MGFFDKFKLSKLREGLQKSHDEFVRTINRVFYKSRKIDDALDHDHLVTIINRDALAQESLSAEHLFAVKEEMEKAEARCLQPYFARSFFMKGFQSLGGSIYAREADRFEITHVPGELRVDPIALREQESL